ncbi:MAG: hypothetical protein JWO99_502 [Candidatus Saccharibacteria bacterium]|nr:hypothetical protein [Candidatus Saccharibacteria bacterium]
MAWDYETSEDKGLILTHVWKDDDTAKKILVFAEDKKKRTIIYYPKDEFVVKEVLLEGFTKLPPEFSRLGYIVSAGGLLNSRLSLHKINSLTISKLKNDSFRKLPQKKSFNVILSYSSFSKFKDGISGIIGQAKIDKSNYTDDFFHNTFPAVYKENTSGISKARVRRAVQSLDSSAISDLTPADIEKLINFFSVLITKRYTSAANRNKLLSAAKIQVDQVAVKDVIKQFEKLLEKERPESEWSTFLQENLFLLNPEYVGILPELNLMLASDRNVDFGLVNSNGYLDIFEIKKPQTQLLAKNTDRGNYYWSTEAVKAITQAEKYLYNAEKKAANLAQDIKRERKVDVKVIKPKAILILGSGDQLDDPSKDEDFQILRRALKNVEIILYDEMLTKLKNQLGKIYSKPNIDSAITKN